MAKGPTMDLSSFTDILTCVLGILILIILLTGIDAASIKVLVPTPKEAVGDDKRPVFFECRNNSLFYIDYDEIKNTVDAKTEEIRALVQDDETLDVIDAALSAACDAGLANVARSLLATRLRHRPDDALMGVLRSFGEPA